MFKTIGIIHSPFREKFGAPSGAMRVPSARGIIELLPPFNEREAIDGLEGASHIWLIYIFNQHLETTWRAKVRPPRLGGEKKIGVFATRSPVRPNPIGLSCVELEKIEFLHDKILIHVRGIDMVDQTPILDIKPYQKDVDSIPDAKLAWVEETPWANKLNVIFKPDLLKKLQQEEIDLIVEVLALDPRPSHQRMSEDEQIYKLWLGNWDISWQFHQQEIKVIGLQYRP